MSTYLDFNGLQRYHGKIKNTFSEIINDGEKNISSWSGGATSTDASYVVSYQPLTLLPGDYVVSFKTTATSGTTTITFYDSTATSITSIAKTNSNTGTLCGSFTIPNNTTAATFSVYSTKSCTITEFMICTAVDWSMSHTYIPYRNRSITNLQIDNIWNGPTLATSWSEFREIVRAGNASTLYPVGTKLYENWGNTSSNAWIIVDYPQGDKYMDSDLVAQGYTNRVMLMEEKITSLKSFDNAEAWLYVETAIPTGTYRFTIPNYDASHGGNKTYIFTSTAQVPVSGQLTILWEAYANPTKVQAYSSSTSTTALFDVNITEWDGTTSCTDLGTIKLAQSDPDSTYGKLNHIIRARYGSNNYQQSGVRQWLNSDGIANSWWQPTNIFDRPYTNRATAGRLNELDSNMKAVIATPTINCITNNIFEYPSLDGTTFELNTPYTVKDKLFFPSTTEVNISIAPTVDSVLEYYVNAQNADRVKYRKDIGVASTWYLRVPNASDVSYERTVGTSGDQYISYVYTSTGVSSACIIQ